MPVAPVDEDRDAGAAERDVGPAPGAEQGQVDAISQAAAVQLPTQQEFRAQR